MKRHGPLRIPRKGQSVIIESRGLPGGLHTDTVYSFSIDLRGGLIVVYVPGHHMGPDNCTPHHPEQEGWLDGLTHLMRRSWGCQWDIHDAAALEVFLRMLEPLVEDFRFLIE